jgi:UDP-N-acetylglucosamine 2-epimerase (non-hydrolysing)
MEAGNRCFDQRVPEEINRKIVDHLSDINMTITEHARRYLVAEGIPAETVIKVGSSMREVLKKNEESIKNSKVLEELDLEPKNYFVLSTHREENLDDPKNLQSLVESINAVAEKYNMPIIFSTHPRTQKKIDSGDIVFNPLVRIMKPLGFADYIKLQENAFCVISDSGTISEESSLLGFPAITVRQAHERPEGMDEGTVIMSNLDKESVVNSIRVVTEQGIRMRVVDDYNNEILAAKVVRIILSYTGHINRTVWKRY